MRLRLQKRYRKLILVMVPVFILLVALGGIKLTAHQPPVQTQPPNIKHVITDSTAPSEKPIDKNTYNPTAGPLEPKYISLPSIGAGGFVQKMGIDKNGEIATPTNVNLAGWYVNSVQPGQPGLSIILGHVDGRTSPGIFLHLAKLKTNDKFSVELGNGAQLAYRVQQVKSVNNQDAVAALFSQDPKVKSQLNLITCGGIFNRSLGAYTQRIIVFATLVSSQKS